MRITRTASHKCPGCAASLDAASSFGDSVPEPMDLTICGYCASVLQFREDMSLSLFTKEQWDTDLDDEGRERLQNVIDFVKHQLALRPQHQN